ncbi:hypothetical protein Kpol_1039p18 [Vanderwaltozyma polyspora DSM 70294]|uniref:Transcriptional activator POG1 n=1 Tax=Vanderwaltozyma polyspora (strain ATCC 22028 / DSM 70294 / BCRC 21397 / CBS 2163 / NBRC 10782 / NRRL Y-8283 / UCD 57-17) TaxID=436907 RepID=POG1_VANPO|nr:uncharacterized protein Kpol_1039p18 [Vanderwaltozyma polyspora DSM 70294]A7THE5.1 RecName: Full=Transcriptional activator POG1 [Vanderwaltozyma polyspora DSM 70294]EDO18269.1 hypothetical protein Kpol_1039p18 [Vanderwaltozyma polyspora DSM 70294]
MGSSTTEPDVGTTSNIETTTTLQNKNVNEVDQNKKSEQSNPSFKEVVLKDIGLGEATDLENVSDDVFNNYLAIRLERERKEIELLKESNLEKLSVIIKNCIECNSFTDETMKRLINLVDNNYNNSVHFSPKSKRRKLESTSPPMSSSSVPNKETNNIQQSNSYQLRNNYDEEQENQKSQTQGSKSLLSRPNIYSFPPKQTQPASQQHVQLAAIVQRQSTLTTPLSSTYGSNSNNSMNTQLPLSDKSLRSNVQEKIVQQGSMSQRDIINGSNMSSQYSSQVYPPGYYQTRYGQQMVVVYPDSDSPQINQTSTIQHQQQLPHTYPPHYHQQQQLHQNQLVPQQHQQLQQQSISKHQLFGQKNPMSPQSHYLPNNESQNLGVINHRRSFSSGTYPVVNSRSKSPDRSMPLTVQKQMNFLIHTPKHPPPT